MNKKALVLAAALALPALQGCFPIVAGGLVAGAFSVTDRRSSGAQVDDEAIELRGANRLSERYGDKNAIGVVSYNRRALLYGQAPDEAAKQEAERIVRELPNVRDVVNEITIEAGSPLSVGGSDTLITTKVKANLMSQRDVPGNVVKVVTERGTVYLLGVVSQREGDAAARVAAGVSGVARVVKVFEYISEDEVRRLNTTPASSTSGAQQ